MVEFVHCEFLYMWILFRRIMRIRFVFKKFSKRILIVLIPLWLLYQQKIFYDNYYEGLNVLDPTLFDTNIRLPDSHHLENLCKYPVLKTDDLNIKKYVNHLTKPLKCVGDFPDLVQFSNGILSIDQVLALNLYHTPVSCVYQGISGALKPKTYEYTYEKTWHKFVNVTGPVVESQFEVRCFLKDDVKQNNAIYKNAFAHIGPLDNVANIRENRDDLLSIDIVGLDSTSLNMFRRHMPKTWNYFINEMGAFHLEGYNKVADNSMVNWLPVFTGMRYMNQSENMLCEFSQYGTPLNLEPIPFIWNTLRDRGCVTMLNDDPMHFTRGLFHYPWVETEGFKINPTDYYFRPWHVYHRRKTKENDTSSQFCFNNQPYYEPMLNLVEQYAKKYKNRCHFSFSFFTDISHDDPNNLELMDDVLLNFLNRAYTRGHLNHSVLIIMGDHGNRVHQIRYTYIGRIEERSPFFAIYFPLWFRKKYPKLMENLKYNKYRLTSNYDIYETLKDIVHAKFDDVHIERSKGISLFQKIPIDRSCQSANIPENHCLCMEKVTAEENSAQASLVEDVILEYTKNKLTFFPKCHKILKVKILSRVNLTTNTMVKHGVRYQTAEFLDKLSDDNVDNSIVYYQVDYQLSPTNITAVIRLQHDTDYEKLFVNVPPLITSNVDHCSKWFDLENFCACMAFTH